MATDQDLLEGGNTLLHGDPLGEDVIHLYVGGWYIFKYLLNNSVEVMGGASVSHGCTSVAVETVLQGKTEKIS